MAASSTLSATQWASDNRLRLGFVDTSDESKSKPVFPLALDYLLKLEPGLTREDLFRFPDAIIQPQFLTFARDILLDQPGQGNHTFTYYIAPEGSVPKWGINSSQPAFPYGETFEGNDYAVAAYNSGSSNGMLGHSQEDSEYIRSVFDDIARLANGTISFREVFNDNEALVSVYHAPPGLKAPDGMSLLGVSQPATNGVDYWRNAFWSETTSFRTEDGELDAAKNRADTLATIRHEIAHTFGGAHPDDKATLAFLGKTLEEGTNSIYQIAAGVADAFAPGITIMSYNNPSGQLVDYSAPFSTADELAFRKMWQSFAGVLDLTGGYSIDKSRIRFPGDLDPGLSGKGVPFLAQMGPQAGSRDYITGTSCPDWFVDDPGDDTWFGGDGDDKYVYKGGFDFASGGKGRDTYYLDPQGENGYLSIIDFVPGQDRIVFAEASFSVIALGGTTLVIGSDTDNIAVLRGQFTEQQLVGVPQPTASFGPSGFGPVF